LKVDEVGNKRKWMQVGILLVVIIVGGYTIANSLTRGGKYPAEGAKAPDFALVGIDGQTHRLSDYKGHAVLVNFWGSYCKPCKEEMPAIERAYAKYAPDGLTVLGVNMGESLVTAKGFALQSKVTFPILLDNSEEIRRQYGVTSYPTSFFILPNGRISVKMVAPMDDAYLDRTIAGLLAK
jgi:peroxiredoxin